MEIKNINKDIIDIDILWIVYRNDKKFVTVRANQEPA